MTEQFLRLPDVLAATGLSRSMIYLLIERKQFPAPLKILGARSSAWLASEVSAWQQQRIAARDASNVEA